MAVEFNPENPLAALFANITIRAEGTVTNPPSSVEATCSATGTVTNPPDEGEAA